MTELSLHILDIVQNSISAKADTVTISISEEIQTNKLTIEITDNGTGMTPETAQKALDPYFTSRTTRKVGMGLPLLKQAAEQCNGTLTITSEINKGTTIHSSFELNHFDRQPLGDIAGVLTILMISNPKLHLIYNHSTNQGTYTFDSNEIYEILEDISVANPKVKKYICEIINNNLTNLISIA
jgi:hypothetical protein